MLAVASNAIIIGFNVRAEPSARKAAEKRKKLMLEYIGLFMKPLKM